jgi:hypothetical protein
VTSSSKSPLIAEPGLFLNIFLRKEMNKQERNAEQKSKQEESS